MMSNREIKSNYKYKWEYKSFHCFLSFNEYRVNNGVGTGSIEVSEFLNMLGEEGWELVSTMQKATDYEQILGGSGHPVGIKAHKNTGYEFIMKRQIFIVDIDQQNASDVAAPLQNNSDVPEIVKDKTQDALLDGLSEKEVDELSNEISIEDLAEAQKSLAEDTQSTKVSTPEEVEEELNTPLLEGPFYSSDSAASP